LLSPEGKMFLDFKKWIFSIRLRVLIIRPFLEKSRSHKAELQKKKDWRARTQIHRLIYMSLLETVGFVGFLITSKVLDARRRGATTEAYGAIRRKEERSKATP